MATTCYCSLGVRVAHLVRFFKLACLAHSFGWPTWLQGDCEPVIKECPERFTYGAHHEHSCSVDNDADQTGYVVLTSL